MNVDYAHKNGYISIPGNQKKGLEISTWCKERGWIYQKDYNWYCFNGEIRIQFKNPKNAMLAGLTWG